MNFFHSDFVGSQSAYEASVQFTDGMEGEFVMYCCLSTTCA